MTRQGRKIDPCAWNESGVRRSHGIPFLSILINNIQVYGADTENAIPTFIVRTLVERGMVAFETTTKEWSACVKAGKNLRTGFPKYVRLKGEDGRLSEPIDVQSKYSNVHVYYANAYGFPIATDIFRRVNTLDFISGAIVQNVNALRQATAIIYHDNNLDEQIERAQRQREAGESTITLYGGMSESDIELKNFATGSVSNIPDFLEIWKNTLEELDALTGRAAIGEKNERRITEEVAVIENAASTSIDVLIDTVNKFAEWYGDDVHAVRGSELRKSTTTPPDGAGGSQTGETDNEEENINE